MCFSVGFKHALVVSLYVSHGEETHIIKVKGTVVSVAMEQHEAGDVRSLGPDLVADAGGSFHLNMTEIGNKPGQGDVWCSAKL